MKETYADPAHWRERSTDAGSRDAFTYDDGSDNADYENDRRAEQEMMEEDR